MTVTNRSYERVFMTLTIIKNKSRSTPPPSWTKTDYRVYIYRPRTNRNI